MASKKTLKKQINAMCWDVIDEVMTFQHLNRLDEDKKSDEIIMNIILVRNHLITLLNQSRTLDKAKRTKQYKTVQDEVYSHSIHFIEQLNELNSK